MNTGHTTPTPAKPRIASTMGKAAIFSEALPFIRRFRGTTIVIKYGGSAMVDDDIRETFADDVAMLHYVGINPIIVHGGGPQISRAMGQRGIEPQFFEGLRVTDEETIRVVQSTLVGEINPDIVRLVNNHGSVAAGVSGLDANLFEAEPYDERLGFVGRVTAVNTRIVESMQANGYVPIIAPIARGNDGKTYNLNADTAAGELASALGASKLVFLTDVEGLYRDLGDQNSLISKISSKELVELLDSGSVSAGMLPKLRACVTAVDGGVGQAHILDGRIQHSLLLEVFTPEGIGTMITRGTTS
ncbi:Acetylglutamate kinase [hydrothermal vent metagenome]|uniref:acetylglutamate kinase n=1 Tax=hydrothermal vent metagenome TaxID=652676 RepID=A0A3B0STZ3_9ZZZZ